MPAEIENRPHDRLLAIVTSCSELLAKTRLRAARLPIPRVLVSSDGLERGKPDPQAYLVTAGRLGVDPAQCVVFEDAEPRAFGFGSGIVEIAIPFLITLVVLLLLPSPVRSSIPGITAIVVVVALGGLHLGGPAFEPIIGATVGELTAMAPDLVVPGHCTGWRAQHALAAALPDAWTAGSSGSTFHLAAA